MSDSNAPRTFPEMCEICKYFNILQVCHDYNIPLIIDHFDWEGHWLEDHDNFILTIRTNIRPDFSKWDGHTGVDQ